MSFALTILWRWPKNTDLLRVSFYNTIEGGGGGGCRVELAMIRQEHEMVFLTTLYLFNAQEACAMAMVGANIIVAHMGLTTASTLGAKTAVSLEDSVRSVQVITDVASEVNPDVIVLCHGGLSL